MKGFKEIRSANQQDKANLSVQSTCGYRVPMKMAMKFQQQIAGQGVQPDAFGDG